MFFANSYLRSLLLSLVSVGLIVPAWATQPCQCSAKVGCCSQQSATGGSCCNQKPCCAAKSTHPQKGQTCGGGCSVGCPCCTEAAAPTTPAPQPSETNHQDHTAIAHVVLPSIVALPDATNYLALEHNSPPGHPALRLHALYRVWLN